MKTLYLECAMGAAGDMLTAALLGAVAHNLAQIAAAALLLETGSLAWYFPALCLSGTIAGVCIGLLSALLVKRIPE